MVCPILYDAPVVQNLGLFLRGIDKPLPPPQTDHDKYPVPSHKAALLDLTTSLHVVHASSRNPLLKPYLESKMRHSLPEKNIVRSSRADRLGRVDLAGWRMTRRLLDVTEPKSLLVSQGTLFKSIKAFSFGAWDDGRWETYKEHYSERSDYVVYREAYPIRYLETLLADLLRRIQMSKPVDVCLNAKSGISDVWHWPESCRAVGSAIRVIHELDDKYEIALEPQPGHSRVYIGAWSYEYKRTNFQRPIPYQDHNLFWSYDQYMRYASESVENVPKGDHGAHPVCDDMRLELCIIPDHRFSSEASIPRQLVIARQIKQALEKYHHDTAMTQEYAKKTLGTIKIYTAEDMPACPCCGLRETFDQERTGVNL